MTGVRIFELAKETGVPSKKLIEVLTNMGYPVKSHSSSIDNYLADRLRKQVEKTGLAKPKKKKAKPAAKKKPAVAKPVAKKAKEAKPAAKKKPAVAKPVAKKAKEAKPAAKKEPAVVPVVKKVTPVVKAAVEPKKAEPKKVATPLVDLDKKRKEEAAQRLKLQKQKEEADKKRRVEAARRRAEEDKRLLAEKEARLKNREAEAAKRKKDQERRLKRDVQKRKNEEEREIQRLIDDEEREKRKLEERRIVIDEATTVKEFAEKLHIGVNGLIVKLIGKGIMATLNQTIEASVAKDLAVELGYEIVTREEEEETEEKVEETEDKERLETRPPVVTIMGHVDHGKTSLLDMIRKTRVTEEEAGGITQRIGAYKVEVKGGFVVFLDTPGHQAFTAMRSRGAAVTDIVVLVVAADDGVMPQTIEAIHHAKAAGVPVMVAVNKIDKPGADPSKVKQELTAHELVPEEWGGETIFCDVSAKEGTGIDHLLEMLHLQAEVLELRANPERMAFGAVVESKLDKGRGPVATVLIQKGTLSVGDPFVSGVHSGKVRALIDDKGKRMKEAGPSTPVEVLGFSGVPTAGESFMGVESERKAHQIAVSRHNAMRVDSLTTKKGHIKLENLHAQITKGDIKDLNIIIKADVQGSIEAVSKALNDIDIEEVRIRVLHGAVGGITETDISLAAASNAIIIGFNVRPTEKARVAGEEQDVDVRLYSIIYNAIDDIKAALEGMLEPVFAEKVTGRVEVRNTFHITKVGTIAGCMVTSGKITRNSEARLIRDDVVIHTGRISSLKRFKDDAKEVASGYECGIGLEKYNDVKISDVIETFFMEEVERNSTGQQKTAPAAG